ncbi:MAG: D-alanyl-D-alanine carboxypeptidase [Candidatus Pacebacteria bacterium]|nr:D-alanyl-D-alanine carboxypeptidase [Candidatus Paceibacterota bacterium]
MTRLDLLNKIALGGMIFLTVLLVSNRLVGAWPNEQVEPEQHFADPYKQVSLIAKAAIVYDPEGNQVLFAKNESTPLPLASLTKVMTALVGSELEEASEKYVSIQAEALATEGDSGLSRDEVWSLSKLIDFTLVSSSNDGAAAIAALAGSEQTFVELMNQSALKMGLEQTKFYNPTGLDLGPGVPGAYGSAFDVARLFAYVLKNEPEALSATSASSLPITSSSNISHLAVNTNELAGKLPGLFASKTGFTDTAGGNLAVAVDAGLNQPLIIVVLGSTEPGRFADVAALAAAAILDKQH